MSREVQAFARAKMKDYLLSSFYVFCRDTKIIPNIEPQPHREMCDEMEACLPNFGAKEQKKAIYLAPRYTYKTSLVKAFMIYAYFKFPNIRIVYGRAVHDDAKEVLRAVKDILTGNVIILEVFGNAQATAKIWAEDAIVLDRPDIGLVDPTIDTVGLGLTMTGKHPDIAILDDLVTDTNYQSIATTERCQIMLHSVYPVLPPWGSVLLTGTRWAPNDVYGWLMQEDDLLQEEENIAAGREKREPEDVRQWRIYRRKAHNPDGTLFFPAKLTEEFLLAQRRSLRSNMMLYSSWYDNEPFEIGMKLFPSHYIQWIEAHFYRSPAPHLRLPDGQIVPLNVSMTVDPAPTAGRRSDATGITVVGWDFESNWYVLHGEGIRKVPSEAATHILNIISKFRPKTCAIETGQADPTMVARLSEGLRDGEMKCGILSYSALQDERKGMRGKDQRIEALEPILRSGTVYFVKGCQVRDLMIQLDQYPAPGAHDDVIDAFAMQRRFIQPSKATDERDMTLQVSRANEAAEEKLSWGPDGPPAKERKTVRGTWLGYGTVPLAR
jgi:predicted phage terminase large subunit-like protein